MWDKWVCFGKYGRTLQMCSTHLNLSMAHFTFIGVWKTNFWKESKINFILGNPLFGRVPKNDVLQDKCLDSCQKFIFDTPINVKWAMNKFKPRCTNFPYFKALDKFSFFYITKKVKTGSFIFVYYCLLFICLFIGINKKEASCFHCSNQIYILDNLQEILSIKLTVDVRNIFSCFCFIPFSGRLRPRA